MRKTLVVLAGPTAVGKTACGIEIATHFGTEIISADSRQIYRETTIGTAVPSPDELAQVRHHFIQTISVEKPYNASIYENQVLLKLKQLFREHHLVVMVGGSGLYIDAVCRGIDELPRVDPLLREKLLARYHYEGLESLTRELKGLDPVSFSKVDLQNPMRVLKALEISIQTGSPYSTFLSATIKERPFHIIQIALDMERETLYNRINRRVERMIEAGLVEEVRSLQKLRHYPAMKTVGYRELFRVLDGDLSLDQGVDLIQRNSRKYARKQLTWFRKENRYRWYDPTRCKDILEYIETERGYS